MSRRFALLLLVAGPLATAATAATPAPALFETGRLTIAGEAFATSDVLDARALPDINGKVGIMLSLTPAAASRLGIISGALVGQPLPVALDDMPLSAELVRKPQTDGVIEIPGRWNLSEAEALARRISGQDPLPDDLAE